ncbi:hypothetical protein IJ750_04555 [bacterium]|nr:hypothetical protein [bacterium]
MAFNVDNYGNITLIQGDSGELVIDGINTDGDYEVYMAIQDKARKPIGTELCVHTNRRSSVVFMLTGDYTDLLKVDKNEAFAIYYYGIKVCSGTTLLEDTLIFGDSEIGDVNTITVYPKKVEGI